MNFYARSSKSLMALAILIVFTATACNASVRAKNIIFIIGDGMGIGAITAARCEGPGENGKLVLDTMPITGLVKTHSADSVVTDSGASGTALATKYKTNNGRISTNPKGESLSTIAELANKIGKSTGVITTDWITGATPAAFYAHANDRGEQELIALQLVASNVTIAMGAGKPNFVSDGRKDGKDVVAMAKQNGFEACFDAASMGTSQSKKILGLFTFDSTGPTLETMLNKTVSKLSGNRKGFFVMAESCLPDKGGHSNDLSTSLKGVNALEDALRYALEFAKKDGHTLVVVTSDHDTGGLAVVGKDNSAPPTKPGWVGGGHTGNMVAVYAFGPGAERFSGTHDNTDIPVIIAGLWGKTLGE